MTPPVCALCHKGFDPSEGGGTIKFADYQPLPPLMVGMPKGLVWFCAEHFGKALEYQHYPTQKALHCLKSAESKSV